MLSKSKKASPLISSQELREKASNHSSGLTMLYGKDLKEYDNIPFDELLDKLTEEEIEQLNNEVDPDNSMIPPSMRCRDQTKKKPDAPFDRTKLMNFLEKQALEEEDWPEEKPYQPGVKRGKVWQPKSAPKPAVKNEMKFFLDLDEETNKALSQATDEDLVDLAGILGLHSIVNQEQFEASVTQKGQNSGAKFDSVVKASKPRLVIDLPDNSTDPDATANQVANNDPKLKQLNWNNIRSISRESFNKLFDGLADNHHLEELELANTGLTDGPTSKLVEALRSNSTLRIINVESNFLSAAMIRDIIQAINVNQKVTEFRASNQKPAVLGNRVEMDIARLVEENPFITRLGLHFETPGPRMRVTNALQKNKDRVRLERIKAMQE